VASLPTGFQCHQVFCEALYHGDFFRLLTFDTEIQTVSVIYVGSSLDHQVTPDKTLPLSTAIRLHSLQAGFAPPRFGLAKNNEQVVYGIVDQANGIACTVSGPPCEPDSTVSMVTYLSAESLLLTPSETIFDSSNLVRSAQSGNNTVAGEFPDTPYDFRQVRWGMSMEEVKAVEGRPDAVQGRPDAMDMTRLNFLQKEVGGFKSSIIYMFNHGRLVVVKIEPLENPRHTKLYDVAVREWVSLLRSKYGPGTGTAKGNGDTVSGLFEWTTPHSKIALMSDCKISTWKSSTCSLKIIATEPAYFDASAKNALKEF
jgi:hypothetical protein